MSSCTDETRTDVPLITIGVETSAHDLARQIRNQYPGADLVKATFVGNDDYPEWLVVGYHACKMALSQSMRELFCNRRALDRPRTRAANQSLSFGDLSDRSLIFMDRPYHEPLRSFLSSSLAKGRNTQTYYGDLISHWIDKTLDEAQVLADSNNSEFDIIANVTRQVPIRVISELLGLKPNASETAVGGRWLSETELVEHSFAMAMGFDVPPTRERVANAARAFRGLYNYMSDCYTHGMYTPDSILAASVAFMDAHDGTLYPEMEQYIRANAAMLVFAGHETTSTFLGSAFALALQHPEVVQQIRTGGPLTWREFVEEALRIAPPTTALHRTIGMDGDFLGVRLKQAESATVLLAGANQDPEVYERPDVFLPSRFLDRRCPLPISFGSGPHTCVGFHLAKLEAEMTLRAVFDRWPDMAQAGAEPVPLKAFSYLGYESLNVRVNAQ